MLIAQSPVKLILSGLNPGKANLELAIADSAREIIQLRGNVLERGIRLAKPEHTSTFQDQGRYGINVAVLYHERGAMEAEPDTSTPPNVLILGNKRKIHDIVERFELKSGVYVRKGPFLAPFLETIPSSTEQNNKTLNANGTRGCYVLSDTTTDIDGLFRNLGVKENERKAEYTFPSRINAETVLRTTS